jgi:hypothetical protein
MTPQVAASIFRLHDDLSVELPEKADSPSMQRWRSVDVNDTPDYAADDLPLARSYAGSYSWIATVLPTSGPTPTNPLNNALAGMRPVDPRHGSFLYEVSVAVFHKREDIPELDSERLLQAQLSADGSLILYADTGDARDDADIVDAAVEDIRANQWIAVAGVHPTTGQFLLKWHRLLSIDIETGAVISPYDNTTTYTSGRAATVVGPEWPQPPDLNDPSTWGQVRAILLPGVIGVTTQTLELSVE